MKFIKALILLFIYIILLILVYLIHSFYFPVNVVFYAAMFDASFALIITVGIFCFPYFSVFSNFEKSLITIILILLGYAISITVPTVIDRSLSFYILEKLDQRGGSIKLSSFENIIKNEFMKEHRIVDVRITEQYESGTITINNDCVQLTKRGEALVSFSLFFRNNLLPKKRLLMGEYTDDLTNPFREININEEDYRCSQ
jgi:uncharacterized membrane protein YcgQ (UPF0703/DUF1980 family)